MILGENKRDTISSTVVYRIIKEVEDTLIIYEQRVPTYSKVTSDYLIGLLRNSIDV